MQSCLIIRWERFRGTQKKTIVGLLVFNPPRGEVDLRESIAAAMSKVGVRDRYNTIVCHPFYIS